MREGCMDLPLEGVQVMTEELLAKHAVENIDHTIQHEITILMR